MLDFLEPGTYLDPQRLVRTAYDPWLAAVSVLVVMGTCYAALRVLSGLDQVRRGERWGLLATAAFVFGAGIWAMDFIGMLAIRLPCLVHYELSKTLWSMLPALVSAGVVLLITCQPLVPAAGIVLAAIVLGGGISIMHYIGLAGLQAEAQVLVEPLLFVISVVMAVLLAGMALMIKVRVRAWVGGDKLADLLGSVALGGAVAGTHYASMTAVVFLQNETVVGGAGGLGRQLLVGVIVAVIGLVSGAALLGAAARSYRRLALSLDAANQRLRQVSRAFETTIEGVMIADREGKILAVNPAFTRMTGYAEAELIGQNPRMLKSGRHDQVYYQKMWQDISANGHWQGEVWDRRKSGELYPQWLTISAIKDDDARNISYVGVTSDITSLKHNQEELARLLHHNDTILNSAGEGILGADAPGTVIFANPAAAAMLGWTLSELIGQSIHHLFYRAGPDGRVCDGPDCPVDAVLSDGKVRNIPHDTFWRKDGSAFTAECTVAPIASGEGVVVVFRDVSERFRQEAQLRLAARVFEASHDGIVIVDRRRGILSANSTLLSVFGYTAEALLGCNPSILLSTPMDRPHLRAMVRALRTVGSWTGEVVAVRKNWHIFPVSLTVTADRDEQGKIRDYIGIITDISEKSSALAQVEYLSRYDPLTGLPNHAMFKDYFNTASGSAVRCNTGMALICFNVDNFKHVNDTLGHTVGDDLLREVASRLKGCIAIGTGDIVTRGSSDEFLILLVDVPVREAIDASIYAIRAVISVPFTLGGFSVSVTASLGVSCFPEDATNFELLFQKADAAVYHAKQAGRNTVRYFTSSMIDFATERLTLKNDLRLALERDELLLHYQPLVDLKTRRIIGAEALLRWQSPEHGFVLPGRFIPVAEESGLIVPIGLWVLRQVCRQGQEWREAGYTDLRLALNISAIQLRCSGFVDAVRLAIEQSGLPPNWLELELTESVLISEVDQTLEVVKHLKQIGVHLAIDDFGTGYSSLSYLQKLKTDKLKIDRSFVMELTTNAESDAIVATIIRMAETMNMTTLAEGVETEEQAAFLRELGCVECQGYLFGRPVSAAAFTRLIEARSAVSVQEVTGQAA